MPLTLREEITVAIQEGFGDDQIESVTTFDDVTLIKVRDHADPIRVLPFDVQIPSCFDGLVAAGIALDVRALLMMDQMVADARSGS